MGGLSNDPQCFKDCSSPLEHHDIFGD